jgi:hypothetical protein
MSNGSVLGTGSCGTERTRLIWYETVERRHASRIMALVLQDFKLLSGGHMGQILRQVMLPAGAAIETAVRNRMREQFDGKTGVQGVRVVDDETGAEIFRWTWLEEQRRQKQEVEKRQWRVQGSRNGDN